MTRTFGLIITLGALAVGGLVAAQNIGPSAQNVASPAPSAPGPAPGPEAGPPPPAGGGQKRIALVVGNSGYQAAPLKTAANDAGLIAQTLQAAGFDVVGARDLDQESTRRALRDFLDKAQASGPDTAAFVYLSGYGVQFEGDNYFVPIDAKLARAADVPVEAVRMSDYTRPLAAMNLKANIIVLDAGRANPFAKSGPPLAGGLALVDAEPGTLIAFNAAPGTVAPDGDGPYGAYAQALAEMIRDGGLQPSDIFNRVRLRVNETTKGAEVPWQSANIKTSFVFFERAADAPPPPVSSQQVAEVRSRSIREIGPQDAYAAALERDTLQGYTDFIAAYPDDPMAGRVRAIMAARREALTWRRTRIADTPDGYWSYLRRYPRGPHVPDAERRLAELQAALAPPPTFAALAYDVPPPPPDEIVYVDRPVLYFSDPVFAFAPPPPPPVIFLAPRAAFWVALPPPPPPLFALVLPIPVYQPIPAYVSPPAYIAPPPPNNIIYNNVHNTVIVNNTTNNVTIRNPAGQTTTQPIAVAARGPAPVAGAPAAPGAPAAAGGAT
ncbi:MAG: caspase domain-containing protein, partial [Xanthobacteraceae bacterium]